MVGLSQPQSQNQDPFFTQSEEVNDVHMKILQSADGGDPGGDDETKPLVGIIYPPPDVRSIL